MYVCNATFSKNQMMIYDITYMRASWHIVDSQLLTLWSLENVWAPSEVQSSIYVYWYINNCLWSWELQYSICDMTMMFNIRLAGEKIRNLSKESFVHYPDISYLTP